MLLERTARDWVFVHSEKFKVLLTSTVAYSASGFLIVAEEADKVKGNTR